MGKTNIEYGERTWNWYPGCNGPSGKPCSYCFARNSVLPRMKCPQCQTLQPHYHPERMEEPCHVRKPSRFLCCFTGDWMNAPDEIVRRALQVMRDNPQHTFLTLTKQPQNLAKWSPFPDNCWVGVSVTDAESFRRATFVLPDLNVDLSDVTAKVKYLSIEPLLNWNGIIPYVVRARLNTARVSWVIIGAQTKPTVLPKLEWVRGIVDAADQAGVKVWLKGSLGPLIYLDTNKECPTWALNKRGNGLRQEIPTGE